MIHVENVYHHSMNENDLFYVFSESGQQMYRDR